MSDVLPELKKGDQIVRTDNDGHRTIFTVARVARGSEFDEPVYFLTGQYGVKLSNAYTGEQLAGMGYRLRERRFPEEDITPAVHLPV